MFLSQYRLRLDALAGDTDEVLLDRGARVYRAIRSMIVLHYITELGLGKEHLAATLGRRQLRIT